MMSPKVYRWSRLDLGPIAARLRGDLNRGRGHWEERRAGDIKASASRRRCNCGDRARDHCPITASKIAVTSSTMARRRIRRSLVAS
jgi:hypothetical protein